MAQRRKEMERQFPGAERTQKTLIGEDSLTELDTQKKPVLLGGGTHVAIGLFLPHHWNTPAWYSSFISDENCREGAKELDTKKDDDPDPDPDPEGDGEIKEDGEEADRESEKKEVRDF